MAGIKKTSGVEGTVERAGVIEGEVQSRRGITREVGTTSTRVDTVPGEVRSPSGITSGSGTVQADRVLVREQIEGEVRNAGGSIFGDRGQRTIDVNDSIRERGGIAWMAGFDYFPGDLVTYLGTIYECTANQVNAATNPADSDDWRVVAGSVMVASGDNDPEQASVLRWDPSTGFEVVEDDNNPGTFIVRVRPPVTRFSVSSSFSPGPSSVFDRLIDIPIIRVTQGTGTFTDLSMPSPANGTISGMNVEWTDVNNYQGEGTYPFSIRANGMDSDETPRSVTETGSLVRYVPEFVMSSQPTTFADFTGPRQMSTMVTSIGSPTFLCTTTDYGAIARGDVNMFPTNFPRVAQITSTADEGGMTHNYNVYRIGIASGSTASMLRRQ